MLRLAKYNIIYVPIDILKGNASIKVVFTPTHKKILKIESSFCTGNGMDSIGSSWYHNLDNMTTSQNYEGKNFD